MPISLSSFDLITGVKRPPRTPAHSERQNSPLPLKFGVSGLLSEEVGEFSEEVGESAGAHVGFRRERVPYNRRILYAFGGYFDVRSEQASGAGV